MKSWRYQMPVAGVEIDHPVDAALASFIIIQVYLIVLARSSLITIWFTYFVITDRYRSSIELRPTKCRDQDNSLTINNGDIFSLMMARVWIRMSSRFVQIFSSSSSNKGICRQTCPCDDLCGIIQFFLKRSTFHYVLRY